METKICRKCYIEKDISNFSKDISRKDGYRIYCKECLKNKYDKKTSNTKKREPRTKEEIELQRKIYYQNNKNIVKIYQEKNKGHIKEQGKEYRRKNYEKILERKKKYRKENPEKIIKWRKNHYEKNKLRINKQLKDRRNIDCLFKLKSNIRGRIKSFLNSKKIMKKGKTFEIIGCSPQELKKHIESQFTEGMSWKNYGFYGWHIDHKMPLDSGKNEEEVYKLCHYTNLQPLWGSENFKKSNKIL
jgi:hypothetical protein